MGIHGIYKEIGSGVRIALSKLAVQKFEETGRPLRLAIDTSIWLFQIQSSKGGTNPALRTFYYRLLRLMSLSIHPLFVFDGPSRPEFKRNKRVGGGKAQVASIPEFLAKQLLKQFGFPYHLAPGEAEAECALLQREGIVDAVMSEDVDTLMFGAGTTIKNWSPSESSKSKTPTHVDLYDAVATKQSSGLDREGMILVAMMSGGDYITAGIPGVGPKLACEAARAGFGKELCNIRKSDSAALNAWKARLQHELKTNESKHFRTKHAAISFPDDFPDMNVLGYYTNPATSSQEKLDRLRQSISWDMDIDYDALRAFAAEAFSWTNLGGAKHFIRNLATPLLVRQLRMRGQRPESDLPLQDIEEEEAKLVHSIHGRRAHASTDQSPEMRVAFKPIDLVPIDLEAEEPDENAPVDEDGEEEMVLDELQSTQNHSKPRAPTKYDPTALEKVWVMEAYVRVGAPLKVQDWEEAYRDPKKYIGMKHANKAASNSRQYGTKTGGMPPGALDRFVRISKHSVAGVIRKEADLIPARGVPQRLPDDMPGSGSLTLSQVPQHQPEVYSLLSSSPPRQEQITANLPPTVTKRRRRSPLRRAQTSPASLFHSVAEPASPPPTRIGLHGDGNVHSATVAPSPPQGLPPKKLKTSSTKPSGLSSQHSKPGDEPIVLSSSPQRTIDAWVRISQSVTPKKATGAAQRPESLPSISEGSPSKHSRLEIRTARIDHDTRITQAAITQIDLTDNDLSSTSSKRQYPAPHTHLTPADISKMDASLDRDKPEARRRWDRWAALTETSGNQPPAPRSTHTAVSSATVATYQRPQPPRPLEKTFVQVEGLSNGFWQEVSASCRKDRSGASRGRKKTSEILVWALEDVEVIDLAG